MLETMHKEIKKAIVRSQHTQRNWDLSKNIPEDDLNLFVHSVTNCPSKQNFAFYNAHFVTDRSIIEKIHDLSLGLGYQDDNGQRVECTNPQTLANLVVIFEEATMSDSYWTKFAARDASDQRVYERDRDMAVGIAAGYLNVTASMLHYQTGCCACYDEKGIQELIGLDNTPILIMGVGFKDPNRQRREHHTDGVKIPRRVKETIKTKFYV